MDTADSTASSSGKASAANRNHSRDNNMEQCVISAESSQEGGQNEGHDDHDHDENENYQDDKNDDDNNDNDVDYIQAIIECGAILILKKMVTFTDREVQKNACIMLSNIAAGTVDQIQVVIDSGAIASLVQLISDKNTDQKVHKVAYRVILNAALHGSDAQIETLVKGGMCFSFGSGIE